MSRLATSEISHPEDGGSKFLRNAVACLLDYAELDARRQYSAHTEDGGRQNVCGPMSALD